MSSYRVRQDEFSPNVDMHTLPGRREAFAVDLVRGKWRIYEQYHDYSATSGGMVRKGAMVRRYDPEAGLDEGKPAQFATKAEAIAYVDRWLRK